MTRIGLVLGAGGVVGQAFHAGVLAALGEVTGWDARRADVIVGTSAGSVAAASLRAGLAPSDLYASATGRPLSADGRALLDGLPPAGRQPVGRSPARRLGPASPELLGRLVSRPSALRAGLVLSALLPEGRRDASAWFSPLEGLFPGGSWPEKDLWICAVSLEEGRLVVFGAPPGRSPGRPPAATVAQAVQASCAIPAVFSPVVLEGRRFVDGGVRSPTNVDLLVGLGLDAVVVSAPMSVERRSAGGLGERLLGAGRLPLRRALSREVERLASSGVPVLVLEPGGALLGEMGLQPMDFRRRAPVAEASLAYARRFLDSPQAREVGRILMKG